MSTYDVPPEPFFICQPEFMAFQLPLKNEPPFVTTTCASPFPVSSVKISLRAVTIPPSTMSDARGKGLLMPLP